MDAVIVSTSFGTTPPPVFERIAEIGTLADIEGVSCSGSKDTSLTDAATSLLPPGADVPKM